LLALQVALSTGSLDHPIALDLRSLSAPGDAMISAQIAWLSANPFHVD
jgi:hypothetical protein